MPEEDVGWAGSFEPKIIDAALVQKLRDYAGQSIQGRNGSIFKMFEVNLETGEYSYPRQADVKYMVR